MSVSEADLARPFDRNGIMLSGAGYVTENFPLSVATLTLICVSQQIELQLQGFRAGDVCKGAAFCVTTAGATLSLAKVALVDALGNRLAISADDAATYQGTTGVKQTNFITPYVFPKDTYAYTAFLSVGTTPPTLARGLGALASGLIAGYLRRHALMGSQADIPASGITFGGSASGFWGGVTF